MTAKYKQTDSLTHQKVNHFQELHRKINCELCVEIEDKVTGAITFIYKIFQLTVHNINQRVDVNTFQIKCGNAKIVAFLQ